MKSLANQARRLTSFPWQLFWLLLICLLCMHPAWSASGQVGPKTANFSLFDTWITQSQNTTTGWTNVITTLVYYTFDLLAVIEICWAAAIWVFEKDNLNSLALEFIKKLMFLGFFYYLLHVAPDWIPKISASFESLGSKATATPGTFSTDMIIAQGLAAIEVIWDAAPHGFFAVLAALGTIFMAALVTVVIIVSYCILAAQYFTTKLESLVCFAAGAVFLGMGASSWTKEYTTKYLNYAVTVGVRLLIIILICELLKSFMDDQANNFKFDYGHLMSMLAVGLMQLMMALKAPEMASALLNGGAGLSAGGIKQAMGAAVAALAPVKMAAGGAVSAVQGANNFKQAVSAGTSMAKADGKTGMSATLGGLGSAAKATAGQMPRSLANAIKGKSGGGQMGGGAGQNPGAIDRAKQKLQGKLESKMGGGGGGGASAAGGGGGASGGSSGAKSTGGGGSGGGGGAGGGGSGAPNMSAGESGGGGAKESSALSGFAKAALADDAGSGSPPAGGGGSAGGSGGASSGGSDGAGSSSSSASTDSSSSGGNSTPAPEYSPGAPPAYSMEASAASYVAGSPSASNSPVAAQFSTPSSSYAGTGAAKRPKPQPRRTASAPGVLRRPDPTTKD